MLLNKIFKDFYGYCLGEKNVICRLKKESEVKEIIYKLLKDLVRDWICFGVVMYDGFWYFMWGDYKVKVVW